MRFIVSVTHYVAKVFIGKDFPKYRHQSLKTQGPIELPKGGQSHCGTCLITPKQQFSFESCS